VLLAAVSWILATPGCGGKRVHLSSEGDALADLAWMSGSWVYTQGDAVIEEHWTPARGGTLFGVNRVVKNGRTVFFEHLRVVASPDGVRYVAAPGGGSSTSFERVDGGEKRVVFENPAHDFPKRILYWIEDGRLHARIEGVRRGELDHEEWVFEPATSAW